MISIKNIFHPFIVGLFVDLDFLTDGNTCMLALERTGSYPVAEANNE